MKMTTPLLYTILLGLIVGCTGCSHLEHRIESDVRHGAVCHIRELKSRDELPGIAADEKIDIILHHPLKVIMHADVEYPFELVLPTRKVDDPERASYVYRLVKLTREAEWKLLGACKRIKGKNIWYENLEEGNPQQKHAR